MVYCSNPFGHEDHRTNKRFKYKELRNVTHQLVASARLIGQRLIAGQDKICTACRLEISKKVMRQKRQQTAQDRKFAQVQQPQPKTVRKRRKRKRKKPQQQQIGEQQQQAGEQQQQFNDHILPDDDVDMEVERQGAVYPSPPMNLVDKSEFIRVLNSIFPLIEVAQIEIGKASKSPPYCRDKLKEISEKLACKLFALPPPPPENEVNVEKNGEGKILKQLKAKFAETTKKDKKIQILSLLPRSWSVYKISKQFNTTKHLAKITKKLVAENGILCHPKKRVGWRTIDDQAVRRVKEFYSSDDISRVCPGKRDYVTVDENNQKIAKQRRLVLMNLKEAYALFKEQNIGLKIGFSKFEPMKKLLGLDSYRDLFKKMLCAEPKDNCNLNKCTDCPGVKEMEKFLMEIMTSNEMESVPFKQWVNQSGKSRSIY